MKEMIRITRKALILRGWLCFDSERKDPYGLGVYHYYVALLKQFVREDQIHITKITEDTRPDKGWSGAGAVIEVVIKDGKVVER